MSLPLILGRAGKTSKVTEYHNAEFRRSDEDDRVEISTVTAIGPGTLRGPGDTVERSDCGHHEDAILEVDVGHRGFEPNSDPTSSDAWQYPVHPYTMGLKDRPTASVRDRRRTGCDDDRREVNRTMDMPDEVGRLHCLSAFLWRTRRNENEGTSRSATSSTMT